MCVKQAVNVRGHERQLLRTQEEPVRCRAGDGVARRRPLGVPWLRLEPVIETGQVVRDGLALAWHLSTAPMP